MPFNGSGIFVRVHNWTSDAANGLDINATECDAEDNGFAAGLSVAVTRDGQGQMAADFLPSVGNTFNLGTTLKPWATLNGVNIANLPVTAPAIGAILYPQTAAEAGAATPVIPTNYQYAELTLERYGGGVSATAAQNNAALTSILAIALVKGGGTIQCPAPSAPGGVYQFSGNFTWISGLNIQGTLGTAVEWLFSGTGIFILMPHSIGRVEFDNIYLYSSAQVGIGIQLGDATGNATRITLRRVVMNGWATALNIFGTTWSNFEKCEFGGALGGTYTAPQISNNYGVEFVPTSNNYTSAVSFYDCTISNNALGGVFSTNTATITANAITWINCNVQNNCVSSSGITGHTAVQFFMGLCVGFTIQGMYMEYVLGGTTQGGASTAPNSISIFGLGYGSISDFFVNTSYIGITDQGGASASAIDIFRGQFLGSISAAISLSADTDIVVRDISGSPVTVSGTGCVYLPSGSGLAPWSVNETAFTPAIAFGTSGSITQTLQAATYSRIGNVVTFGFRINWSAIAAPSGAVTITGFPVAPKAGGPDVSFSVGYAQGLTIASGYLALDIPASATTANVYNVQTTTAALAGAAFAASGSIICSGSYQV